MKAPHIFSHFLLTRFNLALWRQDKLGRRVRTEGWQKERFALFERYCLPSVAAQTCKNFLWLVLFDENTPAEYRQRIAGYRRRCAQLMPFFLNPEEAQQYCTFFSGQMKNLAKKGSTYAISTRLDNDDALNIGYIQDIQRKIGELEGKHAMGSELCLSFTWGYQYFEKFNFLEKIRFPNNHFISLAAAHKEGDLPRCVYEIAHLNVEKVCRTLKVSNLKHPAWLESIHKSNASNDVKLKYLQFPVLRTKNLQEFALPGVKLTFWRNLLSFFTRFLPQMLIHTLEHNRLFGKKRSRGV